MDHVTLLYMSEQLELDKVSAADIKQITKLSITFPTDFSSYVNFAKNFQLLLELLAGPSSILATTVKEVVDHVLDNERIYRDHGESEWTLFPSVLDHIHRRWQMFVHLAGEGIVSKLRTKQINFSSLLEDIEGYTSHYHTPKCLKTKKSSFEDQKDSSNKQSNGGYSAGGSNNPSNDAKKQQESKKGEKVVNSKLHDDLKVPSNLKYE